MKLIQSPLYDVTVIFRNLVQDGFTLNETVTTEGSLSSFPDVISILRKLIQSGFRVNDDTRFIEFTF